MRALRCLLVLILLAPAVFAQESGWCGYALLQGLPLLSGQLAPLESITPDKSSRINPSALFQYRFSLDHSQVVIEGCWKVMPTRDLMVSLLSQTIQFDQKVMADQVDAAIQESVTKGGTEVTADAVVRDYVDAKLVYGIFAPGGTREASAASTRAYIADHLKDWEESDQ